MNPYDFARIDWENPPKRRKPVWHYQLVKPGTPLYSGSLDMDIYAETPIFIADPRNVAPNAKEAAQSMYNAQGEYIIPGSSLKGMLRSVVEALSNSCLTLFDGRYERGDVDYTRAAPREFQHCHDNTNLCLACRTFGMLDRGEVFLGKVNIGDARTYPDRINKYSPIYTAVLVEPKPHHELFYLDETRQHIAGRKFYFHHSPDPDIKLLTEKGQKFMGGKPSNRHIQPLDYDTSFHFRLDFVNLEADEFGALLQALILEEGMRHKIGYGKPTGLGSVELRPTRLTLVDYATRYTQAGRGKAVLEGQEMWNMLYKHTDSFIEDYLSSPAMDDLRRIWRWPSESGISYCYPSKYEWFDTPASKGKRIKDTRNVPGA